MPEIALRTCTWADHEALTSLWHGCGLHPSRSDTLDGLARKLARDPELFLLAVADDEVIGTVLGSYDGRRGWINRLAVRHDWRGKGLADRLMAEVERRLVALGCDKVNLLVEPENAGVQAYYERLGYATDPLIFMEKWLG
jgi:ribosomal protein S18 acetylase RimI-like enzyme